MPFVWCLVLTRLPGATQLYLLELCGSPHGGGCRRPVTKSRRGEQDRNPLWLVKGYFMTSEARSSRCDPFHHALSSCWLWESSHHVATSRTQPRGETLHVDMTKITHHVRAPPWKHILPLQASLQLTLDPADVLKNLEPKLPSRTTPKVPTHGN